MAKKVVIVDYQLGNLFSVKQACSHVGIKAEISHEPNQISEASAIILPGVGAFPEAMQNMKELGLVDPLCNTVKNGTPLFGICLGMQILFDKSEEFGETQGLGLVEGKVLKFPKEINGKKILIPQINWNRIVRNEQTSFENTPLDNVDNNEFMYFVHSFYVEPSNPSEILTFTNYQGKKYCSSVIKKNIFATQFHPEKSGSEGIKIYKNWAQQNNLL